MKTSIYMFMIIMFCGCDPGGYLLLKNTDKYEAQIKFDSSIVNITISTIMNSSFSVGLNIESKGNISVITDSIHIYYDNKKLFFEKRLEGIKNNEPILSFSNETKYLSYKFDLKKLQINDEIRIYGNQLFIENDKYYNLDTLKFIIVKNY